ncbi:MAG: peptidylprolyl isomerase [Thermomicrobiales bacterium]
MSQRRRSAQPQKSKSRFHFGRHEPAAPQKKRRVSRREREARQRRLLYWGMGIATGLIVLVLGVGLVNQYFIKPRHVLATVDGTDIRRRDYWKVRSVNLINQISVYQQYAQFSDASQAQQYQNLAQQAASELNGLWGSTNTDDATLGNMIDDQVYLKNLDDFDLTITDQDVKDYIDQQFQPSEAPIFTPTPSPTLIPARADWATQTAEAELTPTAGGGTPVASPVEGSPVGGTPTGSPAASPVATDASPTQIASPIESQAKPAPASSPEASPIGSPQASPVGSPAASPVTPPAQSPTPNQDQARQTAEAGFHSYKDVVFDKAHVSESDYERLIVRPAIARQKINDKLGAPIGQTAEQVHAAHILVTTKDLADQIYAEVTAENADFSEIAKNQSTDTSTAPNGGDLGWFTRGEMVKEFEDAAFALQPGQISEPVHTQFGWHIIKSMDHQQDRPMTDDQISKLKDSKVKTWLDQKKATMNISSEVKPTATPASETFQPPAEAPPVLTATIAPEASPGASPVQGASPLASPAGSPGASPVVSPERSPVATPAA